MTSIELSTENHELCIPPGLPGYLRSRYLLARTAIKRHLALHLPASHPDIFVNTFQSTDCEEFKDYLKVSPVHFVMTHDGSPRTSSIAVVAEADTPPATLESEDHASKILLRGNIWWWNSHNFNVALINRIEFRDSKVFTMIVESFVASSRVQLLLNKFVHEISQSRTLLASFRQLEGTTVQASLEAGDLRTLAEAISEEELSESYCLAAYGVSMILKACNTNLFMASAFILHSIILKLTPLSQRRLPLIKFDAEAENDVAVFLTKMSDISRHTMETSGWNRLVDEEEVSSDAIDLIDGRLFRVVVQAFADGSLNGVVPRAAQRDWKILSGIVSELTGEQLSLQASTMSRSLKTEAQENDSESEPEPLTVLPFSNVVFDKHLECIHINTDTSISTRLGAMRISRETSHWHKYKKPLNPKLAPVQKVSKWR